MSLCGRQRQLLTHQGYKNFFSIEINITIILYNNVVDDTLTSSGATDYFDEFRSLNDTKYPKKSTFPSNYNFIKTNEHYVYGMSVPPLMTKNIEEVIKNQ